MARIRGRDTGPEMVVRRLAHGLGYRYRLHGAKLPGKPDLVFPSRRKVIFVHGCFWHRHPGCRRATTPTSNREFWQSKLQRNVERDAAQVAALEARGWSTLTIWQCETRESTLLEWMIRSFLDGEPTARLLDSSGNQENPGL
jgi:DNA mismatch endonuclease (patch repair protein)